MAAHNNVDTSIALVVSTVSLYITFFGCECFDIDHVTSTVTVTHSSATDAYC